MIALVGAMSLGSCNKKDEPSTTTDTSYSVNSRTSTLVSSFGLKANSKILNNLDSVKFTIDQDRGVIYNADSLPRGTRVNALLASITCASNVSLREIVISNGSRLGDTTIVYTSSSTDSIDFTGDVTLRITSGDGMHVGSYKVKVNVHKMDVDTLLWNESRRRNLPGVQAGLVASKTVLLGDEYLCLTKGDGGLMLSSCADPGVGEWDESEILLPFEPQVESLTATANALYMLDVNGELFSSADKGEHWTDCGVAWHWIVGGYDDRVLGVINSDGLWIHDEYPQRLHFVRTTVSDKFPVMGMSSLVLANNGWTGSQQAMMAGGVLADGSLSNLVWGYDGEHWACINNDNVLPELVEPVLLAYYTMVRSSSSASPTKRVTWMVMGGRLSDGSMNMTSYVSRNQGINWSKGESGVQQPSHMPAFYGAQVFTHERMVGAGGPMLLSYNPGHVTDVTEWQCPYIYLFGGYGADEKALGSVWEGVLSGLTFKPVF